MIRRFAPDLEFLKKFKDGDFLVTSRTQDDSQWTVAYMLDNGPVKFYRYIRNPERKMVFLFNNRDDLGDYPLVKMHDRVIKSREMASIWSATFRCRRVRTRTTTAFPSIRCRWFSMCTAGPGLATAGALTPSHQWLANRGYAVLSVNYRGSTGFGKEFLNAANGEWSGKMHDDLLDAVQWAVDQKIAEKG